MRAAEAITEFCERTGKPESHVKLVDRALREAGFRSKGRGVHAPHLTPEDWIRLLIGAYGAPVASQAQEFVHRVSESYFYNGVDEGDESNSLPDVETALGLSVNEMATGNLIETLAKICKHVAKNSPSNVVVEFVIEKGWGVEVRYSVGTSGRRLLTMSPVAHPVRDVESGDLEIREIAVVSYKALIWLASKF